jgi:hypothetical protein
MLSEKWNEHLAEILESVSDAQSEGAETWQFGTEQRLTSGERGADSPYRGGFACLWDSINIDRGFGWGVNPWVCAISFKLVQP